MMKINDFSKKYDYPIRAIRYFLETKLTKGKHFYVRRGRLVLPESTQEMIHNRFKARRDYPISYRRINNELGYVIEELKDFTIENQDYIMVGKLYHFSNEGYSKIVRHSQGESFSETPKRITKTMPSVGVTRMNNFSEMTKSEKEYWADNVRLTKEARKLIFK